MGYSNANHGPFFYVKEIMMMYKNQAAGGGQWVLIVFVIV